MEPIGAFSTRTEESDHGFADVQALLSAWLDERHAIRALVDETRERLAGDADNVRITLENDLQGARFRQRASEAELELAQRAVATLRQNVDDARNRIGDLTQDISRLQAERDQLRSDLAKVPWRLVAVWSAVRRYLPLQRLSPWLRGHT